MAVSDFNALASQFALSAVGERPWQDTLETFGRHFNASIMMVAVTDAAGAPVTGEIRGMTTSELQDFFVSEPFRKGWLPTFGSLATGSPYFTNMLGDIDNQAWFRACLETLRVRYQLGIKLRLPGGGLAAVVGVSTEREGHATDERIALLARLAPALESACALGCLIECEAATRDALLQGLSLKSDGVILLSSSGRPVFMSDAAARIVSAGDGLSWRNGEFFAAKASETRTLRALLAAATSSAPAWAGRQGGRMLISRPFGKRALIVHAMPAPPVDRLLSVETIACVLHIQDLAVAAAPPRATLETAFGLSPRESDLAVEFVRHADLQCAAAAAGMAVNTARNHMQNIFRKLGTTSQVETVRLLARLA